jgi:predicted kinase
MQKVLTLVRGLPGSGKSSYAQFIKNGFGADNAIVCSADDFFDKNGVYTFDGSKLAEAHADCQSRTKAGLTAGSNVVVANTFTCRWEMEPYIQIASDMGVRVVVVDCFDGGMDDATLARVNIHDVPEKSISMMRARWEHDWRNGNPIAPWFRRG